jgi:pimeloyl-ACP methyl ester carboxylesterase
MEVDGLHVEGHGPSDGPAIVLVHGAPDRSATFRRVLAHLPGRRVVVYDRRGYGRSIGATPPTGMLDHARDLLAILDRLEAPGVVAAHSFGSNPTMLAVTLRPEAFAAIGLWEPPLVWTEPWPQTAKDHIAAAAASDDPEGMVEAMYRRILGHERWDRLSREERTRRRVEGIAFQVDMASELVAPFHFADVVAPALVGYGTETSSGHVEGAPWLVAHLPNARLHTVPGAGHFAPRTHPGEYAAFVRAAATLVAE